MFKSKFTTQNPLLSRIDHLGFVVRDTMEMIRHYCDSYGIGPWKIYEIGDGDVSASTKDGYDISCRFRVGVCEALNVGLEFIQPLDEESTYARFLKKHGPGLHHINCDISVPLNEALETTEAAGAYTDQLVTFKGGVRCALAEHWARLGTNLEFTEKPAGFIMPQPRAVYPDGTESPSPFGYTTDKPMFTKLNQICVVVHDRWALAHLMHDVYGVGPWVMLDQVDPSWDITIMGRKAKPNTQVVVLNNSNVSIEVFDPEEHETSIAYYLDSRGPGCHHLMPLPCDYARMKAEFEQSGHETLQVIDEGPLKKSAHSNHLDTLGCFIDVTYREGAPEPTVRGMYPRDAEFKPFVLK